MSRACECKRPIVIQDDDLDRRCFKCGKSVQFRRMAVLSKLREKGYDGLPRF